MVYFGRLSPEKNLPFAFELLKEFAQAHPERLVIYDLIGSGSAAYEAKLHSLSAKLPSTIQVNFIGQLSPEALQTRLQPSSLSSQVSSLSPPQAPSNLPTFPPSSSYPPPQVSSLIPLPSGLSYHALLMPSLTENFSYTVLESLQAGIPLLISDQTPWRDLEAQGIGWDLSLENREPWLVVLSSIHNASEGQQQLFSESCRRFVCDWIQLTKTALYSLFE